MAEEVTLIDFDVYGRENSDNTPIMHSGDFAVSNAIVFYVTSRKGDFIYEPDRGGILREVLFKIITLERLQQGSKKIRKELDIYFGALIDNIEVQIIPDFEIRTLTIAIYYDSIQTKRSNDIQFSINMPDTLYESYNKEQVINPVEASEIELEYAGENLLGMVTMIKDTDPSTDGQLLLFDTILNSWKWGRYVLINLKDTDEHFLEIQTVIEG